MLAVSQVCVAGQVRRSREFWAVPGWAGLREQYGRGPGGRRKWRSRAAEARGWHLPVKGAQRNNPFFNLWALEVVSNTAVSSV